MADGRVEFDVVANTKDINASIKEVTGNIEKEARKWDKAADESTGNIVDLFGGMAKGIIGTLSAAAVSAKLLDWGKAAVSAASDLAEVQNVVDVTFGEGAKQIDAWAKEAGKAFGLTETQAKKYTSTLGAMMKSSGIAQNEIISMSTDLAGLAADMASFYNLDFDTAFEKLRSGISGETEPLKQLGVNMSVANLEAFALEQGITKSYNAMSQAEQTTLRYQYIMQATADAQGDFARTSDGFANASRRVATAMETIKTKGGGLLMTFVEPLVTGFADFVEELTAADSTLTSVFNDIDKTTSETAVRLKTTASDAYGMASELEELAGKTDKTDEEQKLWLETCKRLVQTIPGLRSVINAETGEIKDGIPAIREYVKAWEEGQTKLAYIKAHEQKQNALTEAFSDLPRLQLDRDLAARRVKQYFEEVKDIYTKYNMGLNFDQNGKMDRSLFSVATKEEQKRLKAFADQMDAGIGKEYASREKLYLQRKEEYEWAIEAYKEEEEYINDLPGEIDEVTGATENLTEATKEAKDAAKDAIKAVSDYVASVHASTAAAVDNVVKGFDNLSRPTSDLQHKCTKLIEEQLRLNRSTKEGKKRYAELQQQIDELNKSIDKYSPKGMMDGLKSQLAFMGEYLSNLEKAKQLGLSAELLASLSDGSVESAEYLSQLVENPEQAKEVDALFQQVQERKKELTDALTDTKLSGDETYDGLVQKAKEAINDLDLSQEAQTAMSSTIQGLADGISSKEDSVRQAVDGILAQLNRLSGYGIGFSTVLNTKSGSAGSLLQGEYETGLDYVPFDGFLASLHEGESILTAEENRIWQRFKNGASPQTMDYDALGETMRENVKAGGNVYLNGREVGRVISAQQGNDYRAMQRSGFQA